MSTPHEEPEEATNENRRRACTGQDDTAPITGTNANNNANNQGKSFVNGIPLRWQCNHEQWKDCSPIDPHHLATSPLMQQLAQNKFLLKELSWKMLTQHIFTLAANQTSSSLDPDEDLVLSIVHTAQLDTFQGLKSEFQRWKQDSVTVQELLTGRYDPKTLREHSRPGAYLADCVMTEVKVRAHASRAAVQFCTVGNAEYAVIAEALDIQNGGANSPNNVGNVLEALAWVALEEDRPCIVIAFCWHALNLEQRGKGKSRGAANCFFKETPQTVHEPRLLKMPRPDLLLSDLETELEPFVTLLNRHHCRVNMDGAEVDLRWLAMELLLLPIGQAISVPLCTPDDPAWEGRRFHYHGTSWASLQSIVRDNFVMSCDMERYYTEEQWLRNPKEWQGSGEPMVYVAEETEMAERYATTTRIGRSGPNMQVYLLVSIPERFQRWRRKGQRGFLPGDVRPVKGIFKTIDLAPDRDRFMKELSGSVCPMMRRGSIVDAQVESLITTCKVQDQLAPIDDTDL